MSRKRKKQSDVRALYPPKKKLKDNGKTPVPSPSSEELTQLFLEQAVDRLSIGLESSKHGSYFAVTPNSLYMGQPRGNTERRLFFSNRHKFWDLSTAYLKPLITQEKHYFKSMQAVSISIPFDRFQVTDLRFINKFFGHLARLPHLRSLKFAARDSSLCTFLSYFFGIAQSHARMHK